jgi:two-component sensor histidine kinase
VAGLFTHLRQTQGRPGVQLRSEVALGAIALNIDQAIPLGLLVNELVTNSLKYAFPAGAPARPGQRIWVAAAPIETAALPELGRLTVEVGDNGAGLPEAVDLDHPASMGLQLVQSFVKQLRARVGVQRVGGTVFTLTFSVK